MTTPVTLGLVGYGWFAELLENHAFSRLDTVKVTAVCDPDAARRARADRELGVPTFASVEAMLASSDCEAIVVLTPHDTHRQIVEAAAANGRHVFCEKAMAVTAADCHAMIETARTARVELMVGHMQKLFPPYRRLIELVREGDYGEPLAVQVMGFHWCPVFPGWWRHRQSGGGLLYWTGVHDIDTMRHVVGDEVTSVYAVAGPCTDDYTDYEDSVAVTLRFARGAIATLQVTPHDPLRDFERSFAMAVACREGAIYFDPDRCVVEHAARHGHTRGERVVERFGSHEESMAEAYRSEFAHFAEVIHEGVPSRLPAIDGLRCVEILEAVTASLRSGEPIALSSGEKVA